MRYPKEKRLPRRLFLRSTISWMLFGRETGDITLYTGLGSVINHQSNGHIYDHTRTPEILRG